MPSTHAPVGIFDGGIGSYDLVRRIRARFPQQDVIYLADRASFPYGARSESELLGSVMRAARTLEEYGAESIILASNAPSVTVLDQLRQRIDTPVLGVRPPVRAALAQIPRSSVLAVVGAGVMVESSALSRYIALEAGDDADRVVTAKAEDLISLVEQGGFLDAPSAHAAVSGFVERLRDLHPALSGITLSSTHLPWLMPAFAEVAPELMLFDPADEVVRSFTSLTTPGSGQLICLATESADHPLSELQGMFDALGIALTPTLITIPE